jgi:glutathione S-transferase
MITLFQFPRPKEIPNISPYCMKLETYLRLAKIQYKNKFVRNPGHGPKGKLPFIIDGDKTMGDSTFIIDYLKTKHGDPLDGWLTPSQRGVAVAFQRLLEENMVPAIAYFRFVDDEGWQKFSQLVSRGIPTPVKIVIAPIIRRRTKARLDGHGIARHSRDEVLQIVAKDLQAIADALGDKPYFFGDKPATIDLIIYSVIGNMLKSHRTSPLVTAAEKHANLVRHFERMLKLFHENENENAAENRL